MNQFERLDVINPSSSPLFNYKNSLKFLIHGYIDKGSMGRSFWIKQFTIIMKTHELRLAATRRKAAGEEFQRICDHT